jgi:hypothetical protein
VLPHVCMATFPAGLGLSPPPPPSAPPSLGFHNLLLRRLAVRTAAFAAIFSGTWYIVDRLPFFVNQRAALIEAFGGSGAPVLAGEAAAGEAGAAAALVAAEAGAMAAAATAAAAPAVAAAAAAGAVAAAASEGRRLV